MLFPVSNSGDSPVVLSHLQQSQEHTHIDAKPYTTLHDTTTGGSIVFFTMESIYSSCCLKKQSATASKYAVNVQDSLRHLWKDSVHEK